jgi:5-oxoprolinase (ATP-hydrolysing)
LFTLKVEKTPPLYAAVVEVEERLDAAGEVVVPLDVEPVRREAERLARNGMRSGAVALMHSYRNPRHEKELAELLRAAGFGHVSSSSALAHRIKIVPRAETAVVNAYLAEAIESYLERVARALSGGTLHVLTSAGGLVRREDFQPKDSLLSGPAGGVVGAAQAGLRSGYDRTLAFDMGGTSTDVSRFDGDYDYLFETRVGDARLMAPALAIETVAAGGGSVCSYDGRQLKVGPQSAGADPGPACYGAGGPLTLTDVNLLLGRLDPSSFEIPVDVGAAERAAGKVLQQVDREAQQRLQLETLLQGFLEIANERMAEAVRRISIRRGYRASEYALVAFGGAGAQHACALSEILEMRTVLVPADAGLLSALGLGEARLERFSERQLLRPLQQLAAEIEALFEDLAEEARAAVAREGVPMEKVEVRRRLAHLRFRGQESSLVVEFESAGTLEGAFLAAYEDHYGYRPEGRAIELESIRAVASSVSEPTEVWCELPPARPPAAADRCRAFFGGEWAQVLSYRREELSPGTEFVGPALIWERHSATVVHDGWRGKVDEAGGLVLERNLERRRRDLEPGAGRSESCPNYARRGRAQSGPKPSSSSCSLIVLPPSPGKWERCCGGRPCRSTSRRGWISPARCWIPRGSW